MAHEEKEISQPFFITYTALDGEANYADFITVPEDHYAIAPRADIDPWQEAEKAKHAAKGSFACVLMPCSKVDAAGTRNGRGGGWYDQFLSVVPQEWMRVCFCFADQFTSETLKREAWDQPVDRIGVVDRSTNKVTWHETHARGSNFDFIGL
ncbi:MAG: 5-formyltetrahydrofolate cyclo-ligase [Parcubacteria group bacterium]|jgi:5-formyltetrahydrofolate cyclo-ligase|nr:5-formyltetrahydrofolate cyclo-ligase [Parcubacteria group bacterium]